MTVAVTGADSGIGKCFAYELMRRGHEVIEDDGLNLKDPAAVSRFLKRNRPAALIHCRDMSPELLSYSENIAECCAAENIPAMLISSCEVFGAVGDLSEKCLRMPKSDFGLKLCRSENAFSKYAENNFILRLPQIIYGQGGDNDIVCRLMNSAKVRKKFTLNCTCIYSSVYAADAAELGVDILMKGKRGIYHCANEGECTMFSFACETFRQLRLAGHEDYFDVAVDPFDSGGIGITLNCEAVEKAGIEPLDSWQNALKRCVKNM